MASVIVFGPTGNVASIAARTAQEKGAKVYLAMRDTSKSIPGLSKEQEQSGGFERVQADLSKPDSITEAIKTSGAKRAFIYLIHSTPDFMRGSLKALKAAGVDFLVFLSSFTVHGDPRDFKPQDIIPFVHAQGEIALDEVYGEDNYVALRPGGFATNLLRHKEGINSGEVRLFGGGHEFDCITPEDMGTVAGTILVDGPKEGQKKVYLYGPKPLAQYDAIKVIAKVLGKDVTINRVDEQEGRQQLESSGIPKPMVDYMVNIFKKEADNDISGRAHFDEGVNNVERYTGKKSMGLEEWVGKNKELFSA